MNAPRPPARRRRSRRIALRCAAVLLGLLTGLLAAEAALLGFGSRLDLPLQTLAFCRYDTLPGGMYVHEPTTRMHFMRANHSIRTFSHGYWWHHATDGLGYRNPPDLERRDVLLLGDSLIYGHGVEEHQTVSHFLRRDHAVPAYNAAQQAHCLYEEYVTYRLLADVLRPKTVVLFVFLNDVRDLEKKRRPEEIADPPELERYDYRTIAGEVSKLQNRWDPLLERALFRLATTRLAFKWHQEGPRTDAYANRPARPKPPAGREPAAGPARASTADRGPVATTLPHHPVPRAIPDPRRLPPDSSLAPFFSEERYRPVARYTTRILSDLSRRCEARGTRLVLVHLFLHKEERGPLELVAQQRMRDDLSRWATANGVEMIDTEHLFTGGDELFLPHDGHFTEIGHRRLAAFLAKVLSSGGDRSSATGS